MFQIKILKTKKTKQKKTHETKKKEKQKTHEHTLTSPL